VGAAAINDLMEDTATAEIARSQLWQWVHHGTRMQQDGRVIDADLVRRLLVEQAGAIAASYGGEHVDEARDLLERVVLSQPPVGFLTLAAYERLP
jgi:malate synthase